MPGPEAIVERTTCKRAKEQGWTVRKVSFLGTRGAPDRLFGRPGRGVFIEFKRAGGDATKQQARRHAELRSWGFEVHVCDTIEQAADVLELL